MLKSTLSLIALTATAFTAEAEEESWSLPTSPRTDNQSVDMSLTGSPYSDGASRGSAPMSLCSSLEGTPTHQPQSARTTPSPTKAELDKLARKITSGSNGRGSISPEDYAKMLAESKQ